MKMRLTSALLIAIASCFESEDADDDAAPVGLADWLASLRNNESTK